MRNRPKNDGLWQSYVVTHIPDVSAESESQESTTLPVAVQRVHEGGNAREESNGSWLANGFYKIAFFALLGVMGAQLFIHLTRNPSDSNEISSQVSQESNLSAENKEFVQAPESDKSSPVTDPAISSHLRKLLEQSNERPDSKQKQDRTQRLITAQRPGSNIHR